MERLTMNNGLCQMASTEFCLSQKDCYSCPHGRKCFKRLAAYEDTGLEPEEAKLIANVLREVGETYNCWFDYVTNCVLENSHLKELAQAEKDGRLVVLPYKIGDLVYRIAVRKKYLNHSINTPYSKVVEIKPENAHKYINEIGKTVFLTREEAEAALKMSGEADNETD